MRILKMSKVSSGFNLLTYDDTMAIVQKAFGPDFTLVDHYFETHSERPEGFLGSYWALVVTAKDKLTNKVKSDRYFIKTIPSDPLEPSLTEKAKPLFYKETNFYNKIVPELFRHDDSWCPRCYLATDGVLVFEDLKVSNFRLRNSTGLLDTASLKCALEGLAKLHASSILAEKRLGKTFGQLHPMLVEESLFTKTSRLYTWVLRGIEVVVAVSRTRGYDVTKVPDFCRCIFDAVGESKKWRNVLCHGDSWCNNLMFDESSCVLVDFQMVRYAPAMTDVVQLLYFTTRQEYRKRNELLLLQHYHRTFSQILGQEVSFDEMRKEFEDMRKVGIISLLMYFPVPLAHGLMTEEFYEECGGMDALVFEDRVDIVLGMMAKYPEFNDRILEVISELMDKINGS